MSGNVFLWRTFHNSVQLYPDYSWFRLHSLNYKISLAFHIFTTIHLSLMSNSNRYSQLPTGTTPLSLQDALSFLTAQASLEKSHLIDVFAPHGVFTSPLSALTKTIQFLGINYTFRHGDEKFLSSFLQMRSWRA